VSAGTPILNYSATNLVPAQKDQPLFSSKRRSHFQTHKWHLNEQKFGHGRLLTTSDCAGEGQQQFIACLCNNQHRGIKMALHGLTDMCLNILRLDSAHPNPIKGYFGCRTTEVTGYSSPSPSFEATDDSNSTRSKAVGSKYSFEEQYVKCREQILCSQLTRRLPLEDKSGRVH
jgi:hypothetical protein